MGIARWTMLGALVALTWAIALRSWMTHLAYQFDTWPVYTWEGTFLAVLAPAVVVGGLIGWDQGSRLKGAGRHGWIGWSPLLLAVGPALLADNFIGTLMETGEGGGAIGVVILGLSGGWAISGRGASWSRWVLGGLALIILGSMTYGFYLADPPFTSSNAFGALFLAVLMVWLCLGCSLPMRPNERSKWFQENPGRVRRPKSVDTTL